ncbi:DUF6095 family protein [Robertkochia solimangrovi]|uniref:DUF6095 family protein n=1 Tax=Robertkochia solimangrovi TaxID=2213046 RepID=UPI00117CFC1C|nr:DUF6095 family protein [Robertkochia solimangrovi]TRZ45410.1 hypothetical protein DMZ48_06600 [Robertkochia solimangrovi]
MKETNKALFFKSLKFFSYTLVLMFAAPVLIYEAFKNQGHPFYWPVLILGLLTAVAAIGMGFYSIRLIIRSIFEK